jgi:hypothetical protein
MTRILLLVAVPLLFAASPANAQYIRGPVGTGPALVFPSGTVAWNTGLNSVNSGYFYVPPVNYNFNNPVSNYGVPSYGYRSNRGGYYVAPNGGGGGGYYSTVPNNWNYYNR